MFVKDPPVTIVGDLQMLGTNEYPIYLYQSPTGCTIFEGGIGTSGPLVQQQLQQLGVEPAAIHQLIITHAHPDHVMAVPGIREICPGIQVLASAPAAATLAIEKAVSFFCKLDDGLTAMLKQNGLIAEDVLRPEMRDTTIQVDRVLEEGQRVAVADGVEFEVLETPGHSDCSLSFWEPTEKVLIISDATGYYLPQERAWWPNYFTNYGQYMASIERLATFEACVLCLSHNAVIRGADDVAAYFRDGIADARAYHQRILSEHESGKSVREIAEILGAEVHQRTPLMPLDFFQKNCGILVKNSLKYAGIDA